MTSGIAKEFSCRFNGGCGSSFVSETDYLRHVVKHLSKLSRRMCALTVFDETCGIHVSNLQWYSCRNLWYNNERDCARFSRAEQELNGRSLRLRLSHTSSNTHGIQSGENQGSIRIQTWLSSESSWTSWNFLWDSPKGNKTGEEYEEKDTEWKFLLVPRLRTRSGQVERMSLKALSSPKMVEFSATIF